MSHEEILVFEVAGCDFALPLALVEEVIPASKITAIPNSPPFFLGLAAVRGRVMGVVDAAKRYGLQAGHNSHFLICRVRGNLTAVAIDRPVVAGMVPVRSLEGSEIEELRAQTVVDKKFLKNGFELLEVTIEGAPAQSTGRKFWSIDADLFVSAEMAGRVGEA